MKKYTTVNNWVCQNFITSLVHGSYRQCCFLAFNTFDECLHSHIKSKMLRYFFNQFVDTLLFNQLINTLPLEVKSYINTEFYKYLHMRKINEIIVHCSATYPEQKCTVEDIRKWHKERGFNDIGYHFIVYKDGIVVPGRKLTLAGAHCQGHNARSIGICYVGGLDDNGYPFDTRTECQKQSLISLINALCNQFPIDKISGHNQYSSKACPCFDAQKEYSHLIKKLL